MKLLQCLLLLSITLVSCKTKSELVGVWFHSGLVQMENTFYTEAAWKTKLAQKPSAKESILPNQREDLYLKLQLNKDHTFTEQLFDLKTNEPFDKAMNGKWEQSGEKLILTIVLEKEQAKSTREFVVQSSADGVLKLKIIKELATEKGKIIMNYDLAKKEEKFATLIKQIGIDTSALIAQSKDEYDVDFWEFTNFGKYQILTRRIADEDSLPKFSKNIDDAIHGYFWDEVAYYDPIFANASERVVFNAAGKMKIIYQALKSRSGWCGTLSNGHYPLEWSFNQPKKEIRINFPENAEPQFEIQKLFRTNVLQEQRFKILAKNKYIMIWEN